MKKETVSLKKYVDQRFDAADKAIGAALISQEKAILKAETANEKRLEVLNELRGDVAPKAMLEALREVMYELKEATATKTEMEAHHKEQCIKIDAQATRINTLFRIAYIGIGLFTAFEIFLRMIPMIIK